MGYGKRLIYEKENQLIYDVKIVRRFLYFRQQCVSIWNI